MLDEDVVELARAVRRWLKKLYCCLPDGLPAPVTPIHTAMLCMHENARNVATEAHLCTERLEVSCRTVRRLHA
jgi:hypothetical protein